MGIILVIIGIVLVAVALRTYNTLISYKNSLDKSKSDILVNQKKMSDMVKKIIRSAEVGSQREIDAMNSVTSVHKQYQMLQALAEQYPTLRSTDAYNQMSDKMERLYHAITNKQEEYNAIVEAYNIERSRFPAIIIASMLGFSAEEYIGQDRLDKATELGDITDFDDFDI